MVGWVGPRTEGPFSRGFRPPGSPWGWLRLRLTGDLTECMKKRSALEAAWLNKKWSGSLMDACRSEALWLSTNHFVPIDDPARQ